MKFKKQNIIKVAAFFLGIVFLSSCEDYFEKEPSDKVNADDHYKTFIDLQISQAGVFTLLQDIAPNLVLTTEAMADMTTLNTTSDNDLIDIYNHEISSDNSYLNSTGYYKIIIAANEVIEKLDSIKSFDRTIIEDEDALENYDRLFSYLVVLKSWCYLTLVKLHGEAAYFEKNVSSLPENLNIPYLTREVMLDTLLSDLDSLSDVNEDDFDFDAIDEESTTANNVLMQVININAVIGEIYLEKQNYEMAAEHLQMACEELNDTWLMEGGYDKTNWKNMFTNNGYYSNKNEIMFRVVYNLQEGQENILEKWIGPTRDFLLIPHSNSLSLFENQKNGDENRGVQVTYDYTLEDSIPYINKYSLGREGGSHIILYRSADIVLMLAEALNRMGESEVAMKLVNDGGITNKELRGWTDVTGIRKRAGLPVIKVTDTLNVVTTVENYIMDERSLELAFEGKRWFDLMRVARRRNNPAYLANAVSAKYSDPAMALKVKNHLMNVDNWYLPFNK